MKETAPHIGLVGVKYTVTVAGKDTNGRFCVIDMHVPPGGGPLPHRHEFEETFILLDGEMQITFRGQKSTLRAGDTGNVRVTPAKSSAVGLCGNVHSDMAKERHGVHLIAEIAQVSRGTVDRALHGRDGINEETRQRVLEIARQIGYKPNLAARALSASRPTAKIGVCIPREIHFFYDQLWSGVLEEAERVSQSGVEFINRPIKNLGEGDVEAFRELISRGVDGIILTAGNPKDLR